MVVYQDSVHWGQWIALTLAVGEDTTRTESVGNHNSDIAVDIVAS